MKRLKSKWATFYILLLIIYLNEDLSSLPTDNYHTLRESKATTNTIRFSFNTQLPQISTMVRLWTSCRSILWSQNDHERYHQTIVPTRNVRDQDSIWSLRYLHVCFESHQLSLTIIICILNYTIYLLESSWSTVMLWTFAQNVCQTADQFRGIRKV